jgi:hypothetical protein
MVTPIGKEIEMTSRRNRMFKVGLIGTALFGATLGGAAVADRSPSPYGGRRAGRWSSSQRHHLAHGYTLRVAFYRQHPDLGGEPVDRLTYTEGRSNDLQALADFLGSARRARYAVMAVDGISVDLGDLDLETLRDHLGDALHLRGHGPFGGFGGRRGAHDLNPGASVEVEFYSGLPGTAAVPISRVRYVHGETDEAAFEAELLSRLERDSHASVRVEGVVSDLSEVGHAAQPWGLGRR